MTIQEALAWETTYHRDRIALSLSELRAFLFDPRKEGSIDPDIPFAL